MSDTSAVKAGEAYVEASLKDDKLKAGMAKMAADGKQFAKNYQQVTAQAEGGFMDRLALTAKQNRKEKRASGETALEKTLSGGGMVDMAADALGVGLPVMVADQMGKALQGATGKAIELRDQLKKGTITQEEMIEGLARGIPVLGSWVGAFSDIGELMTGNKAAIEEINEETKRSVIIQNSLNKSHERFQQIIKDINLETAKRQIDTESIGKDPFTKAENEIRKREKDMEAKRSEANDKKKQIQTDADTALETLRKAKENADRELYNFDNGGATPSFADLKKMRSEDPAKALVEWKQKARQPYQDKATETNSQLDAAHRRVRDDQSKIDSDFKKSYGGQIEQNAAERAQLAKDQAEKDLDLLQDQGEKVLRLTASIEANKLRLQGEFAAAARREAEVDATIKKQEVEKQLRDTLKGLPESDPTRAKLTQGSKAELSAVEDEKNAKINDGIKQQADEERNQLASLQKLKTDAIQDTHQRQLQEIKDRYAAERDTALAAGKSITSINANEAQETANLKVRQAADSADAQRELDQQIATEDIHLHKKGLAEKIALLEQERAEALRKNADPRTANHLDPAQINRLYDMRKALELRHSETSLGSFSADEIARMGGGSRQLELEGIVKNTQATIAVLKSIELKLPLLFTE